MQILFLIGKTNTWNRKQAFVLAREHIRIGYVSRIIDIQNEMIAPEDHAFTVQTSRFVPHILRTMWLNTVLCFSKKSIVHVFGVQTGFLILFLRLIRPDMRIILHVDDVHDISMSKFKAHISCELAIRFAHMCITSRKESLRHELLFGYDVTYVPYAISAQGHIIDPSILRSHGLELQQFFLAYVNPEKWDDLEMIVREWRAHLKPHVKQIKLAIVFTKDTPMKHIVFGHDITVLGCVTPYVLRLLQSGARAVLTPTFSNYKIELMHAMAHGKYGAPLHDLINRNPFVLESLTDMYHTDKHDVTDLLDPAMTMSWGHIARTIIEENHHPEMITQQYETLYEEILFAESVLINTRTS